MPYDTLITIAIFIGIAIVSSWLKKKQAPEEEQWPSQPPPPVPGRFPRPGTEPPPHRPKAASWEEELRKLLEGDEPATPAAPPPVIVYEAPKPVRPPPMAPPPLMPRRTAPVIEREEEEIGLPVRLPSLTQSTQAYQRASQLDVNVAERLRQIGRQVTLHTVAPPAKTGSADISLAKSMLRKRHSLRSAIVASVILGPPKALGG